MGGIPGHVPGHLGCPCCRRRMKNILTPSLHDNDIPMYPTFHIKCMCNTQCGKSGDHIPHSASQDNPVLSRAAEEKAKAHATPT